MNYLGQHLTASVAAMRVLVRVIGRLGPQSEEQLLPMVRPRSVVSDSSDEGPTLPSSRAVASDLGLLSTDAEGRITLGTRFAESVLIQASDNSQEFRRLTLIAVAQRGLEAVRAKDVPSDVALALAWLLTRNPLQPLNAAHAGETETLLKAQSMDSVVMNRTQWAGFRRWCVGLGVADELSTDSGKYLQVAPGRLLASINASWRGSRDARDFIRLSHEACPVLGHPELVALLPESARPTWQSSLGPTLSLGLVQMESRGQVTLARGEDAAQAVRLEVGGVDASLAAVTWIGGADAE